jgi:hypothetical protein
MEMYSVVSLVSLSVTITDNDKGELALILFLVSRECLKVLLNLPIFALVSSE